MTENKANLLKISPFWISNPKLWFITLEAQFEYAAIKEDEARYIGLLGALGERVLCQVQDELTNPPRSNKYNSLKDKVLQRFETSEDDNLQKLLRGVELGDKTPSQLLGEMKVLGGNHVNDNFLHKIWLTRLPTRVTEILEASNDPLAAKAKLADKIYRVTAGRQVDQIQVSDQIDALTRSIAQLSATFSNHIAQISGPYRDRGHSNFNRGRSRSRPRNFKTNNERSNSRMGICFYHSKFGAQAQKCRQPCNYNEQSTSKNYFADR